MDAQERRFTIAIHGGRAAAAGRRGAAIYMVKETLIKYLYRHAGEYQHPVNNCFD